MNKREPKYIRAIGVTSCVNCPFGITVLETKKMILYCKPQGCIEIARGVYIDYIPENCPLPKPKELFQDVARARNQRNRRALRWKLNNRLYHFVTQTHVTKMTKDIINRISYWSGIDEWNEELYDD